MLYVSRDKTLVSVLAPLPKNEKNLKNSSSAQYFGVLREVLMEMMGVNASYKPTSSSKPTPPEL